MERRKPIAANVMTSELPPKLINGSGMPVVGINPETTDMLNNP
jgi:hypothetical protein